MARYSEHDTANIYLTADAWKTACILGGKSLLWPKESVWSEENLKEFKKRFIDNPDESQRSFEEKFKLQLEPAGPSVTKLACELVLLYFLFPSSVSGNRKRQLISEIASWKSIEIDGDGKAVLARLDAGIGGPGLAYNTRRPFEIGFLGEVGLHLISLPRSEREAILNDHSRLRTLLDDIEADATRQSRDILLHLLFPDRYERIASRTHKRLIAETFQDIIASATAPDDLDDRLFEIRTKLEQFLPGKHLDFYWQPLTECWYVSGEDDDLSPLQGLSIQRQVVLYGPPGTGKTFEARALADRLIRQGLLRAWGPKKYFGDVDAINAAVKARMRRVQFHPGYSYEDLVRGLRLNNGGATEYSDGILLRVIADIQKAHPDLKDVPYVLILDEMNRADLSKVLGECFSLLEDRDAVVQLGGQDEAPREITIPPQLHFVGTMNLIDQSLEQVDFALRRRFLWFFRGFDRGQFIEVSRYRWDDLLKAKRIKKGWERYGQEFEVLADRAEAINREIERHPSLGPQYQIGHTYFCDVVYFVEKDLAARPGRHFVLYSPKGHGRDNTIGTLWKYSLKPLLEQYLSGVDAGEKQTFLSTVEGLLLQGPSA